MYAKGNNVKKDNTSSNVGSCYFSLGRPYLDKCWFYYFTNCWKNISNSFEQNVE